MRLSQLMWRGFAAAVVATALGCSDESGPREYEISVARDLGSVGGAILQVSGGGVTTFEAIGATLIYSAPVDGVVDQWRVVILDEGSEGPRFLIRQSDSREGRPTIVVIGAVDAANQDIDPLSEVTARFGS